MKRWDPHKRYTRSEIKKMWTDYFKEKLDDLTNMAVEGLDPLPVMEQRIAEQMAEEVVSTMQEVLEQLTGKKLPS